jgi:hypothetical protein
VNAKRTQDLRVSISGLELSAEQNDQVCGALRQAVLQTMANLDFGGDRVAVALPLMIGGGGGTQGIRAAVVSRMDLEQLADRDQ